MPVRNFEFPLTNKSFINSNPLPLPVQSNQIILPSSSATSTISQATLSFAILNHYSFVLPAIIMPSGHKKKNSKQAFAVCPSQNRNVKMGKENRSPENKAEGDLNRKKGKKKNFLAENEGEGDLRSRKSFFYSGLTKQMDAFDSMAESIEEESLIVIKAHEAGKAAVNKAKATPMLEAKESAHGKENKLMENEGESMEASQIDEVDAISLKNMAPPMLEADKSAHGKEEKLMIDASESMEESQNGEANASSPKIEIPHPPMVVRRASKWNCCGLREAFKCFQP